jgi:pimeloyl-ACP methyl ester carboxylesterase
MADSGNRFHFTKPENASTTLPLLIILDSGGDGLFALKKVTPALTHIPCVAIASDVVKNNFADYESAIEMLISEASRLHQVNSNQVFLVGFSGAARMAFSYSTTHSVSGVIMCSAAPPRNAAISCPVYVISGTADFNFGETYRNPVQPGFALPYKTDYFKGTHAWPPVNHLEDGLFYLMLRSIPDNEPIIHEKIRLLLLQSDSTISTGEYLLAWKALEKARALDAKNKKVRKALLNLKKDKNCNIAFKRIESDLIAESSIFQSFSLIILNRKGTDSWYKLLAKVYTAVPFP